MWLDILVNISYQFSSCQYLLNQSNSFMFVWGGTGIIRRQLSLRTTFYPILHQVVSLPSAKLYLSIHRIFWFRFKEGTRHWNIPSHPSAMRNIEPDIQLTCETTRVTFPKITPYINEYILPYVSMELLVGSGFPVDADHILASWDSAG